MLIRDRDWAALDGLMCEVTKFTPMAKLENGRVASLDRSTPYAFIEIKCSEGGLTLPPNTRGAVCHKLDFAHLWTAFVDRGVNCDEKIFIVWSKRNLRSWSKLLSMIMPRMGIFIFKYDGYELISNNDYRPGLTGVERWEAMKPIFHLQPDVWN